MQANLQIYKFKYRCTDWGKCRVTIVLGMKTLNCSVSKKHRRAKVYRTLLA